MGFMFRVRLSSFFAGATAASVAGFYYLYKDYMLSQQAIFQQVKGGHDSLDERIDVLNQRIIELEKLKTAESPTPIEASDGLVLFNLIITGGIILYYVQYLRKSRAWS